MENNTAKDKRAVLRRAAGIACFFVAAVFAVYLVLSIVFTVEMAKSMNDTTDYGEYFIVYLFMFFFKRAGAFVGVVLATVFVAIGALFVTSGVCIIGDSSRSAAPSRSSTYIKLALALSIAALAVSFLPFVLGFCRTVVRPAEEWKGFVLYGLMPFAPSLVCFVLNLIAAKKIPKTASEY